MIRASHAHAALAALVLAGPLASTAGAQDAVSPTIAQRKALFKAQGEATKPVGEMLRGRAPFDLAKVTVTLAAYVETAQKLKTLFPDDSRTGGGTEALASVWERSAEFNALMTKFETDSAAALASIKDEASFKAAMPGVLGNCGTCHNAFKAKG